MIRRLIFFVFLLYGLALNGQDIQFDTEYPAVVAVGDQFRVTWIINSRSGDFTVPALTGFYKIMGPQTSYSSSTQIINGKVTQETSYSYTFYLQALNEGEFTIDPASLTIRNETYYSDSLHIQVVKSGTGQQSINNGSSTGTASQQSGQELFIRLVPDRNEVYIGEHVTATLKIYTRVDLAGLNEIKYPDFNGFFKKDIETPPLNSLKDENINGTTYGTGVIQQFVLYPQITGEVVIDPVEITALVQQRSGAGNDFFGGFFSSYETLPKVVLSEPVKLNVKPLPGEQPDTYSGAVGSFSISSSLSNDSVVMNDALTFKIVLSGSGNLNVAGLPIFSLSPDIEIYDPKVTDNSRTTSAGTTGQKIFEYLLIPRHNGDYSIPPVKYSYFNPSKRQFETLTTSGYNFHVIKSEDGAGAATVYGGILKEDVKYVGKDIRYIKSNPGNLVLSSSALAGKRSFYTVYGFALLAFVVILLVRKEHVKRTSDISAVKNRKAGKIARKRLMAASKYLNTGQRDQFHEEILKALWGYLSDKLNISISDLTRINAISALRDRGADDSLIQELSEVLDKCEFERYAPSSAEGEIDDLFASASGLIQDIENVLS